MERGASQRRKGGGTYLKVCRTYQKESGRRKTQTAKKGSCLVQRRARGRLTNFISTNHTTDSEVEVKCCASLYFQ